MRRRVCKCLASSWNTGFSRNPNIRTACRKSSQVVVEVRYVLCGIHVVLVEIEKKFLRVGLDGRGFLQVGVGIEVTEANPVVECDGRKNEHYHE